jgi:hypothetical protein
VDFLLDHLAEACFLGEPFTSKASNGMPANLNGTVFPVYIDLTWRYDIRLVT